VPVDTEAESAGRCRNCQSDRRLRVAFALYDSMSTKKSSARGRYIIRWTVRMERPPTTVNYAVGYKKVPLDIRS